MIYISDIDPRHYITGSTLLSLPREERDSYHTPDAKELYALIDSAETWDSVSPEAYEALAYLLDLDIDDYEDGEAFMQAAAKAIEAPHE